MIKDRNLHYQEPAVIKAFQEARLKETLNYLAEHSAFYKRMFEEHNIDISKINTLEDLTSIPTTSKQDLQEHNDDFICANETFVSIHAKNTGKRNLYFKAPCSPYEVYEKKFYGENITQLELDMYLGQTLTFSVRGVC